MMYTFPKSERLCSKILINRVFTEGLSITRYPVKAVYLCNVPESEVGIQVLFTIPKRNIRKSSRRNFIRRRMREAYRLNRNLLTERFTLEKGNIVIALIFLGRTEVAFSGLQTKISWIFHYISESDEKTAE